MRHIFIGDIHGCLKELNLLIEKLDLESDDALIFLGDLVDRGPDSIGVIRRVKCLLGMYPNSVAVAGNHESKVIEQRRQGCFKEEWTPHASEEDWAFLKSLPLLKQFEINGHRAVAVHGGFYPRFFECYWEDGLSRIREAWHKGGGKYMSRARRFLYTRFIDENGRPVTLGKRKEHDRFWTDWYDGREGYVFYGHEPYLRPPEPRMAQHACGLDTACVFGGRLTAAVVSDNPKLAEFVSVPALKVYSEPQLKWLR